MVELDNLIEAYKRRLKTAQELVRGVNPNSVEGNTRLGTKISCYSYFIIELERLKTCLENE